MPLELVSTTEEKVHLHLAPSTTTGKPAKIDGAPVWTIITGAATFAADPDDPNSQFIISEDVSGVSTWQVQGDADLGEGVETISDSGTYTYNAPNASNLGLSSDAPEPK